MADTTTVCSMCGDIGFPDKLFQCTRCLSRFQHSYCSNYYQEEPSETARVCDWCLSEERAWAQRMTPPQSSSKKYAVKDHSSTSGNRAERRSDQESRTRSKSSGSLSSSKHAGRRYKLLKDVLC